MFVCNVLFCFVLLPIVKIVLMQICFRKPEIVYYEYCSSANKNIKKKKKKKTPLKFLLAKPGADLFN